ncbi:methyltransferase, FxLD system [Streptomyces chrestomyceticus]|uniref:methyltransferase, FxLD system n=1 Tax=Streptomyces chrestomyceticus TaxID=68185 RepID=UPI0033C625BA
MNLRCETWQAAEQMAVQHLGPLLSDAEATGRIDAWWFIRKRESWRLRVLPTHDRDATVFLGQMTRTLTERAAILRADSDIYESETRRFGGAQAMEIAHDLFHADSRQILAHLACQGDDHRNELGVRLATRMMLAAGQDLYEQGDVWAQLAEHRGDSGAQPSSATRVAVQMLLTAQGDNDTSPLTRTPGWPTAFEDAGRALAGLAHHGQLSRGLRAVLTDHLLFAFNRLGICATHQNALATAASRAIFHRELTPATDTRTIPAGTAHPTTVRPVTMHSTDAPALDAHELREALIAKIDSLGSFRTEAVKDAFRTVPRHVFLPGVDLQAAYAPKQVVTKRAQDGTAVSSASGPNIVAKMLEQLDARPGMRVLEIGAATGLNAALLAELVGPTGSVITIELDDDLADGARARLAEAGYQQVTVLCRDGALGDADSAPFDRIIVTAGAWDIATAWWQQLAVGGRLVVPLRLHGSGLTRSIAFTRTDDDRLVSNNAVVCGFVPMRGTEEMSESHVRLAEDAILKIDAEDQPDEKALARALCHPAGLTWTGIQVRHDESAAHLDLWLATVNSGLKFGKLSIGTTARSLGLADPALRWSGASLYTGGTFAYLTARPVDDDADELGIVAHGPHHHLHHLRSQTLRLLHSWAEQRPGEPTITAHPASTPDGRLAGGARITRPNIRLTISW